MDRTINDSFFSLEKEIYTDETKNLEKVLKSNIGKFSNTIKKELILNY